MVYSKREEFAPKGSKFFPFGLAPFWAFQKGFGVYEGNQKVTKVVSFVKYGRKSTKYQIP